MKDTLEKKFGVTVNYVRMSSGEALARIRAEKEIKSRLVSLRRYLRSPTKDPHLSLEEIFKHRESPLVRVADPVKRLIQKVRSRRQESTDPPEL